MLTSATVVFACSVLAGLFPVLAGLVATVLIPPVSGTDATGSVGGRRVTGLVPG